MDTKAATNSPGGGAKPTERLSSEETVRLGKEIYERDIRHQVEADHVGEIVAIDVDSGSWAMGDDELAARPTLDVLRTKRPQAVDVLFERVGYTGNGRLTAWGAAFVAEQIDMEGGRKRRIRVALNPARTAWPLQGVHN